MKNLIIVVLIAWSTSLTCFSQDYQWNLENRYTNKKIEAWDITPKEELIVSVQGALHKLDTNFVVEFTQSNKQFGEITKIDARHSLKILLFSENQQIIGFLDNTLSFQDAQIDLGSLDIGYAQLVCYANQTNRFWVYDEQNARLVRFQGIKSSVAQSEISNLMSITYNDMPTSMMESQNQLLLFYQESDIYVFDYYGSLLRNYSDAEALQVYPTENYIYVLKTDSVVRIDRKTDYKETIKLPVEGIEDLRVFGNAVYFKDKNGVSKYSLIHGK